MKKIGYDIMQLDTLQVIEDSRCCLKVNAVITKEGVYPYPDGRAFKSRMELLKATHTARNAKITILDHPDSLVVMSQKQINGIVEKPFFDRDRIRAVLNFDKSTCPTDFLDNVRNGKLKDVSIGFYYQPDMTPGKWNDKNYDYVMRDIVIDHVAAGVVKGRCSFPDCGIGVDTMMRRIALDPCDWTKTPYSSFEDCVAQNQDKGNPEAYCGEIKKQVSSASNNQGGKNLSEEKDEMAEEFIKQRMSEGLTREAAELQYHELIAKPPETQKTLEPKLPASMDADYPWDQCISDQLGAGYSQEQADKICAAIKNRTVSHASQFNKLDLKQAVKYVLQKAETDKLFAYNLDKSVVQYQAEAKAAKDQATEPTDLQKCVTEAMGAGKTEAEATDWCKAELAGEHQTTDSLIGRSQKLISLREQTQIEKNRSQRRHPM
jgi:hypothetical protein